VCVNANYWTLRALPGTATELRNRDTSRGLLGDM
jgi:hypothetical protein